MKKGTKVKVEMEGYVLNFLPHGDPNKEDEIVGVRITDKKRPSFWSVVPLYAVTEETEEV